MKPDDPNLPIENPKEDSPSDATASFSLNAFAFTQTYFSGPLPPPEALEHYAQIFPDAPKIIFESFERLSVTRADGERAEIKLRSRSLNFAFATIMVLIAASVGLIVGGFSVAGLTGLGTTIAVLGGAFIYREIKSR
jgi:uncharacterized membrane protein